jgi:hypothetical protein
MDRYGIRDRRVVYPRAAMNIGGITFEAFPVEHSLRAPAVGYRITVVRTCVFYVPDLVSIADRSAALSGVTLYIGDGASLSRPLIRRRGRAFIGHATVAAQLAWCHEEGIRWAVFSHCGSQIVRGAPGRMEMQVRVMGQEFGIKSQIAHDGMSIILRGESQRSQTAEARSSARARRGI